MSNVKRFGLAGTLSYVATEVAFWAFALPAAFFGYHATTGEWLSLDTDRTQLLALAATFVTGVRFAVPLRLGVALALVPSVQRFLDARQSTVLASSSTESVTPSGVVLSRPAAPAAALAKIGEAAAARVQPNTFIGLGSGRAAVAFARCLGQRLAAERETLVNVRSVPTSDATAAVAREAGVPLCALLDVPDGVLDLVVDGADEVAPSLDLLKGGGGNLAREKMCEWRARELIILVGAEKVVPKLGSQFPVFLEVLEFGLVGVESAVKRLGGRPERRMLSNGAGPFVTDDGNAYLACFFGEIDDPRALDDALHRIPGVVDTGLFLGMATEVFVANVDGSTRTMARPPPS